MLSRIRLNTDAGSQYTSIAFTAHLAAEGIVPSIGSVGDALDNALMESAIGLYKTELTDRRGRGGTWPTWRWRPPGYLHWFNRPGPLRDRGRRPG